MHQTIFVSRRSRISALLRPLLVGFLATGTLLLGASAPAEAAVLDWSVEVWNDQDLSNTYTLSNGVEVTITFSTAAAGIFVPPSPNEDGPNPPFPASTDLYGPELDLALRFNPDPNQGQSPVVIDVVFDQTVTDVSFEISDIDYSQGGVEDGILQDFRRDQVVITSNAANPPTLTAKNPGTATFSISGNTATANCTPNLFPTFTDPCTTASDTTQAPSDDGTVLVDFGSQGLTTVTITYNEASGGTACCSTLPPACGCTNPASRGIGTLFMLEEVPVELMSFTIE